MIGTEEHTDALAEPPALKGRWTICAMLFVATTINYMDRQVLSILKPALAGTTLHLQPFFHGWPTVERSISMSEVQYGNIVWCFQIAYALGVIFAGRFVDRVGCRRGYPIVTGLWSLAAMGHALVTSVMGFGVARFLLGLGESGIFNSGAGVGAILAPFVVPWVALHFGWRAAFLVTGVFSATWIVWWSIRYRSPRVDPRPKIAWTRLLRYRQTWGFVLGKFLTDPVWWFYLFWLPSYFNSRFKVDMAHIGPPLIIVYVISMIGSVFGGWLPKGFVGMGMSLQAARLAAMLTCACLVVPIAFAGGLRSIWMAIALLSVAASAHQGWSANIFSTASDMFPAEYVGTMVSFGQVGGALGGAIFAQVAGHILQLTGSYVPLFLYSGCAYLAALLVLRTLAPGLKRAVLES